jgi:hypothetical protein
MWQCAWVWPRGVLRAAKGVKVKSFGRLCCGDTFRLTPSVCVDDWGYGGLMWRKDQGEGHSCHYLPRKPCVFCDLLCSFSVWPGPAQTDERSG